MIPWVVSEARREVHGYSRHYGATEICDACGAVQLYQNAPVQLNFANFSDNAGYVFTEISHELYLATSDVVTPWVSVPGFRHESVLHDILHSGPLGVDRDLCGSSLINLLECGRIGSPDVSPDQTLKCVWNEMRNWARAQGLNRPTGVPFSLVSLGRGRSAAAYPELSRTYKVSEV